MNMEVTIPAIILENEEDDSLIYCISAGATDMFKKRKDERYYSTLIGRYLTDREMKFRKIFQSFEGQFPFNLDRNKRRHNSKLQSMADTDFS